MRAKHSECEFHESWLLPMWILWELIFAISNKWELSFGNVDFMRAKHCECEFYESWSLRIWIIWQLSFVNANFITAEHCECEFIRTEHCECEFMTADYLKFEFLGELSFTHVNFMGAEHCRCEFYGSWALQMWILWEFSFGNVNLMRAGHWKSEFVRAGHCGYEFDEHWVFTVIYVPGDRRSFEIRLRPISVRQSKWSNDSSQSAPSSAKRVRVLHRSLRRISGSQKWEGKWLPQMRFTEAIK